MNVKNPIGNGGVLACLQQTGYCCRLRNMGIYTSERWGKIRWWFLRGVNQDIAELEVAIRETQRSVEKIETWIKEYGGVTDARDST